MNRLTNQYGAFTTPLGEAALSIVSKFEAEISEFIKYHKLTPEEVRILSSITNADNICAVAVLSRATMMKKAEIDKS